MIRRALGIRDVLAVLLAFAAGTAAYMAPAPGSGPQANPATTFPVSIASAPASLIGAPAPKPAERALGPATTQAGPSRDRGISSSRPAASASGSAVVVTRTPRPSARPTAKPVPAVRSTGVASRAVAVRGTWYCDPPRSRCTRGYPASGMYAAISPDLRAWTGRLVRVRYAGRSVVVRIVDCNCQAEHAIDLFAAAFRQLAPTSVGEITVTLELLR